MNIQQPKARTEGLTQLLNKVDTAVAEHRQELTPPDYSEAQRKAISACITGTISPICEKVGALHRMLDAIEQATLQSGERAEAALKAHVETCRKIEDEVAHMSRVIEDLQVQHGQQPQP